MRDKAIAFSLYINTSSFPSGHGFYLFLIYGEKKRTYSSEYRILVDIVVPRWSKSISWPFGLIYVSFRIRAAVQVVKLNYSTVKLDSMFRVYFLTELSKSKWTFLFTYWHVFNAVEIDNSKSDVSHYMAIRVPLSCDFE